MNNCPLAKQLGNILNRLNYSLRKTQKAKPLKKLPETDAIFDNVHKANQSADENSNALRISIERRKSKLVTYPVVEKIELKNPNKLTITIPKSKPLLYPLVFEKWEKIS